MMAIRELKSTPIKASRLEMAGRFYSSVISGERDGENQTTPPSCVTGPQYCVWGARPNGKSRTCEEFGPWTIEGLSITI